MQRISNNWKCVICSKSRESEMTIFILALSKTKQSEDEFSVVTFFFGRVILCLFFLKRGMLFVSEFTLASPLLSYNFSKKVISNKYFWKFFLFLHNFDNCLQIIRYRTFYIFIGNFKNRKRNIWWKKIGDAIIWKILKNY